MEWSTDKTYEFIEALQELEVIWNPKHIEHKDRNAVHEAWMTLHKNFNVPVKDLKKKKDALLATYRKLSRKVSASKGTGTGAASVYKPTWFAYDALNTFLHGIYVPGNTINSEVSKLNLNVNNI